MPDTNNSFMASLFAAMENNTASDEVMAKGPKDGDIEPVLNEQNDPSGNSGSPGDETGTPVAKPDPDAGAADEGDPASVKKSDDESGNPPSPGDNEGTAAVEASLPSKNKANGLSINQVAQEFIKAYGASEKVGSTMAEMNEIKDEDLEVSTGEVTDANYKVVKCGSGYALVVKPTTGDITVIVRPEGKKLARIFTGARMRKYLAKYYDKQSKSSGASAASEAETVDFTSLVNNIKLHGADKEQELTPAKDGHEDDPDGPGVDGDPVSPGSDSKPAPADTVAKNANDPSGNPDSPGVNGTPVSKSGDSEPLPKTEAEKVADDKSGNPPSPGVNGTPAPGLESFIAACEQLMIEREPGVISIPNGMSLESYATQLGLAEIASRAMEADLTAAERRALPDSEFGLPDQRKWPLNDESHVRSAIQNFHWCPKEDQRELAKNILKAMRKFDMKDVQVSEGNPFLKYYPDAKVVARKKAQPKTAE